MLKKASAVNKRGFGSEVDRLAIDVLHYLVIENIPPQKVSFKGGRFINGEVIALEGEKLVILCQKPNGDYTDYWVVKDG